MEINHTSTYAFETHVSLGGGIHIDLPPLKSVLHTP